MLQASPQYRLFTMPSRISDAFKAHPLHLNHRHLDLNSVQELPDLYAWAGVDESPSGDSLITESVPVIDLTDPNASELVGHACKSWGVFQVTNHGIPGSLLDDIESAGRSLFSLPAQQKLKAARSPDGVAGYGLARISSFFNKLMWYEGFTIFGSPLEHARQLWPQDYTKFWYSRMLMHTFNNSIFSFVFSQFIFLLFGVLKYISWPKTKAIPLNATSKDYNESHGPHQEDMGFIAYQDEIPLVTVYFVLCTHDNIIFAILYSALPF